MDEPWVTALIDEGMRKAGLVWLTYGADPRARAAWHVWRDGAAYVVSGGSEQLLPDISLADRVVVTVPSKDTRGRLLAWVASRTTLEPAESEGAETEGAEAGWEEAAAALGTARLNALDRAQQLQRWRTESTISRLSPTGEILERPDAPDAESHRAVPPETPATTLGRQPLMYGGLPRSKRQ